MSLIQCIPIKDQINTFLHFDRIKRDNTTIKHTSRIGSAESRKLHYDVRYHND